MLSVKCASCSTYTDLDFEHLKCPDCGLPALSIPIDDEIEAIHKLLDAEHDLIQVIAKAIIKIDEDLAKLEQRIFPPEEPPTVRRGKMLN